MPKKQQEPQGPAPEPQPVSQEPILSRPRPGEEPGQPDRLEAILDRIPWDQVVASVFDKIPWDRLVEVGVAKIIDAILKRFGGSSGTSTPGQMAQPTQPSPGPGEGGAQKAE